MSIRRKSPMEELRHRMDRQSILRRTLTCSNCGEYWSDRHINLSFKQLKNDIKFECPFCNNIIKIKNEKITMAVEWMITANEK